VVTGDARDDRRVVVRVDEGEVVRTHGAETVGVLVDESRVEDGVDGVVAGELSTLGRFANAGGRCGVVGPFSLEGLVAHGEEEDLDGVRETEVVSRLRDGAGRERLTVGRLHLFDEDVTGSAGHAFAFVVGDDGIVCPDLDLCELGFGTAKEVGSGAHLAVLDGRRGVDILLDEEFVPVAEAEVDPHLVVREGGSRESDAGIARVEERKREVEHSDTRVSRDARRESCLAGLKSREGGRVTDHLVVAILFASRHGERRPEVEVEGVEARRYKVVEGDTAILDKIVHEVSGPSNTLVLIGVGILPDLRETNAEPRLEEVIAGARDADRPVLSELRLARRIR